MICVSFLGNVIFKKLSKMQTKWSSTHRNVWTSLHRNLQISMHRIERFLESPSHISTQGIWEISVLPRLQDYMTISIRYLLDLCGKKILMCLLNGYLHFYEHMYNKK